MSFASLVFLRYVLLSFALQGAVVRGRSKAAFELIADVNLRYDLYRDDKVWQADIKMPRNIVGLRNTNGGAPIRYKNGLWRGGVVPYTLASSIHKDSRMIRLLKGAMAEWEKHTCIQFRPRKNETDFIEFYYGEGCNSNVGRVGGRQTTSLGRGCGNHGIILHELGHVVGFWHEQNRPDRDEYVTIKEENIMPKFKFAFDKYSTVKIDSLGVPYDYFSVMHYNSKAFSKNYKPTIVSKAKGVKSFGNNHLSPLDIKQANLLYDCPNYPDFPQDFVWKNSGPATNESNCLRIHNPQATGWQDNSLCSVKGKKDLGLRFSSDGPVSGMKCLHITNVAAPKPWTRTYFCWPRDSMYEFTWKTSEPDAEEMKKCLKLTEPTDALWDDNKYFLCGTKELKPIDGGWSSWMAWSRCTRPCGGGIHSRTRTCTNPPPSNGGNYCTQGKSVERTRCNEVPCKEWPRFPEHFSFYKRRAAKDNDTCVRVYERRDYTTWRLYLFCSDSHTRDPEIRWSDSGVVARMRCTKIYNPAEKIQGSWDNNYLCVPSDSPYRFIWSYVGPIAGKSCLRWFAKDGKDGWNRTFLCADYPSTISNANAQVDGAWSEWKPWTACSKSCASGTQRRVRTCSNPVPKNGGRMCVGVSVDIRICSALKCPAPCGQNFKADQGSFTSPNYPASYPSKTNCSWRIQVRHGNLVRLNFFFFDVQESPHCVSDSVKLYDGSSVRNRLLGSFCGSDIPQRVISSSSTMLVKMTTNSVHNNIGFSANWESVEDPVTQMPDRVPGCSGHLRGDSGMLTSPQHPKNLSSAVMCAWTISVPAGHTVSLDIGRFGVSQSGRSCGKFYIEVFDGNSRSSNSLGKFCGSGVPGSLEASSNHVYIVSRTEGPGVKDRFLLAWRSRKQNTMATTPPLVKAFCGSGWILHVFGGTAYCYKVQTVPYDWFTARRKCMLLNADLLSISGREEQDFVNTQILSRYFMWMGYNDNNQEGLWSWSDDSTKSVFTNWARGDPNNGGHGVNGEDCAVLKTDGLWNDYPCSHRFKSICKIEAKYMTYAKGIQGTYRGRG